MLPCHFTLPRLADIRDASLLTSSKFQVQRSKSGEPRTLNLELGINQYLDALAGRYACQSITAEINFRGRWRQ